MRYPVQNVLQVHTAQWVRYNVQAALQARTVAPEQVHARPVMLEPTPASSVQILHPRARRVWLVRLLHFRPVRPVASVR